MQERSKVTTVYLVRHGQTAWNLEPRCQGHLDIPLNDLGIRQAEAVAEWLNGLDLPISAIYSSDLRRAARTAELIGTRVDAAIERTADLREIDYGQWTGQSLSEIDARYPGDLEVWDAHPDTFTLPGGESVPDVQHRAFECFQRFVQNHRGQCIAIVAHGLVLTALLAALQRWNLVDVWHDERRLMANTGVAVVHWDHETATSTLPVYNSLTHLSGLLAGTPGVWSHAGLAGPNITPRAER